MLGRLLCPYTFQDLKHSFQNTYTDVKKKKLLKREEKLFLEMLRRQVRNSECTTLKEASTEGMQICLSWKHIELTAKNTYLALFSTHLYK